jgi:cystathionine beta-synthase
MRYAHRLVNENVKHIQEHLIVVILPDSGSRYLSKFYDDKWMRENGFLEPDWSETTLNEILARKTISGLITTCTNDRMTDVISTLKLHDVSQMPALRPDGTLAGLVTEVDLLNHLLTAGHDHVPEETIENVIRPADALFPASALLESALPALADDQIVLVTESDRPVGILTKIDILDFIAQKI